MELSLYRMKLFRLDVLEAFIETVTAIANSRIKLRVAKICLTLGVNLCPQKAISKIKLMRKVRPAAMIRKAAN